MDLDEIPPNRAGDPLAALLVQDLDPLSVRELEARVASLRREIERTTRKMRDAVSHRATADDLFRS